MKAQVGIYRYPGSDLVLEVVEVKNNNMTFRYLQGFEDNKLRTIPNSLGDFWKLDETSNVEYILSKYEV